MRDWALSIGKGVPKNQRRTMRGAAKDGLYEPRWGKAQQPYETTYEQRAKVLRDRERAAWEASK
jgi:hypothetical protein